MIGHPMSLNDPSTTNIAESTMFGSICAIFLHEARLLIALSLKLFVFDADFIFCVVYSIPVDGECVARYLCQVRILKSQLATKLILHNVYRDDF